MSELSPAVNRWGPSAGDPEDRDDTTPVHGVCHLLNGSSLAALDVIEGNGTAYQRGLPIRCIIRIPPHGT